MSFEVYNNGGQRPLPGVGKTAHTDTRAPGVDYTPTRPIASVVSQVPPSLLGKYSFVLSRDRLGLTIDPVRQQTTIRGDFSIRDSVNGGKVIRLEGGPFENAEWITASLRDLVKGQDQLDELHDVHQYDLDFKREMLVVNGKGGSGATIFAMSKDPTKPGLVAVCSKATVLDMDGSSRGGNNITVRRAFR